MNTICIFAICASTLLLMIVCLLCGVVSRLNMIYNLLALNTIETPKQPQKQRIYWRDQNGSRHWRKSND